MDEAIRVLFLPVGHSRNPLLVGDPLGPLGHSRNPLLASEPLGPLAPLLLIPASSCRPPDVGEDVDVIQPQGVQACSPELPGPIKYTLRKENNQKYSLPFEREVME